MVRWSDGLFGGLLAGLVVACFYAIVGSFWVHDLSIAGFFAQIASGIIHTSQPLDQNGWAIAFGVALHFLLAAVFGIIYSFFARRIPSMWQAPFSVMWGMLYGLIVWFALNAGLVPLLGIESTQPAWEGLVGNTVFFGFVLSEFMTVMHRRQVESA
jgi:hypothetical protein